MKNAPPSPPTPAEVAEARTFLTGVETGSAESFMLDLKHSETYRRHAAVLVRAALADTTRDSGATPAEQPREDGDGPSRWLVKNSDDLDSILGSFATRDAAEEARDRVNRAYPHAYVERFVARSVSPSAVPAVSAGGAGRDLTAADVRDSYVLLLEAGVPTHEERQFVAEHLNAIARPADTGTQATEQTTVTLRRVLGVDPERGEQETPWFADGDSRVQRFATRWHDAGFSNVRIETEIETTTTTTSVSPWSPVDVHDEEQQR